MTRSPNAFRKPWLLVLASCCLAFCLTSFALGVVQAQDPGEPQTAPSPTEEIGHAAPADGDTDSVKTERETNAETEALAEPALTQKTKETPPTDNKPAPAAVAPVAPKALPQSAPVGLATRLFGFLGIAGLLGLAILFSRNRKAINWRLVVIGLGLQWLIALLVLKTGPGAALFEGINVVFVKVVGFTESGSRFLFGSLVDFVVPAKNGDAQVGLVSIGAIMAFRVLPIMIFFSSLTAILYYLGVLQKVVQGLAFVMQRTMRTSGAESLSAAGNVFLGQTESPMMIRPFLEKMTMSELNSIMTGGFATVAGTVLGAYIAMLQDSFPNIGAHLIAASVMAAPGGLVLSKILWPETEESATAGSLKVAVDVPDVNVIDAAARGASEGMQLALNVGAMLIAFIALIAMLNAGIGLVGGWVGLEGLSFEKIVGVLFWPFAWLIGIPAEECFTAGQLIGVKTVVNEFVAFQNLSKVVTQGDALSPRSAVILSYALCGFANFGSIAIQLGGLGGMAPSRRHDLAKLGLRAMFAGTLTTLLTATIAGILV